MPIPIQARPTYLPPQSPKQYDPMWLRGQLGAIARALPPNLTREVTAADTLRAADDLVLCDASGGAFAFTLLPADQVQWLRVTIKRTSAAGTVTITAASGDTIDGAATVALSARYAARTLMSDGATWHVMAAV